MLLNEPPPSPGDLRFRLFGIPVRVHPFFWIVTLVFAVGGGQPTPPLEFVIWVAVVFVSILVHEMGHALVQRYYGGHPWITLHGMGGLASCDDCDRRPSSQIAISLAGPMAGFLLAAAVVIVVKMMGHPLGWLTVGGTNLHGPLVENPIGVTFFRVAIYWEEFAAQGANSLLHDLLWVNIGWGLINLLPVYPLDGGRVSRELCTLGDPRRGIIVSLWISCLVAGAMAAYALVQWKSLYTAALFGYLAYGSFQTLQAYQARLR